MKSDEVIIEWSNIMVDQAPMGIKDVNEKDLLAGMKKMEHVSCSFCHKALTEETGSYIVSVDGKPMPACKDCYMKRVTT